MTTQPPEPHEPGFIHDRGIISEGLQPHPSESLSDEPEVFTTEGMPHRVIFRFAGMNAETANGLLEDVQQNLFDHNLGYPRDHRAVEHEGAAFCFIDNSPGISLLTAIDDGLEGDHVDQHWVNVIQYTHASRAQKTMFAPDVVEPARHHILENDERSLITERLPIPLDDATYLETLEHIARGIAQLEKALNEQRLEQARRLLGQAVQEMNHYPILSAVAASNIATILDGPEATAELVTDSTEIEVPEAQTATRGVAASLKRLWSRK